MCYTWGCSKWKSFFSPPLAGGEEKSQTDMYAFTNEISKRGGWL